MIVVVSPHVDDAVLSLGGSMLRWRKDKKKVHLLTVFSESVNINAGSLRFVGNIPARGVEFFRRRIYKHFFSRVNYVPFSRMREVTALRKGEELSVAKRLGSSVEFLDFVDDSVPGADSSFVEDELFKEFSSRMKAKDQWFFPLALGSNPDHVVVRNVADRLLKKGKKLFFYEDLPYAAQLPLVEEVVVGKKSFKPLVTRINLSKKLDLVSLYSSQVSEVWLSRLSRHAARLNGERYWKP